MEAEWPYNNKIGNCWCGHSKETHDINNDCCISCQCVGFMLDTWAKIP